jgi:hypothetical protein
VEFYSLPCAWHFDGCSWDLMHVSGALPTHGKGPLGVSCIFCSWILPSLTFISSIQQGCLPCWVPSLPWC